MAFSFGFSGDDIEEDPNDVSMHDEPTTVGGEDNGPPPIPAQTHSLDEMLSTLPSKLSFTLHPTTSPLGHKTHLPRRPLFDIRLQLMSEDDSSSTDPLTGLQTSDLQPNVYEGGYKTWECSLDLVKYLLDRGPRKDLDDLARVDHVVELGCGTALPSLLLFMWVLRQQSAAGGGGGGGGNGMMFTLCDYNVDVLRLVSLPNLFLGWVATLGMEQGPWFGGEKGTNPLALGETEEGEVEGDLEVTAELVEGFKTALREVGIQITLVSGSWTPSERFLDLIPSAPELNTFILGSETIYSPAALNAFTEAMVGLMKRVRSGKAIVAAKRVYFGVGGSVDGFREECARRGCVAYEMEFEGLESDGVRRCLVEVQMY